MGAGVPDLMHRWRIKGEGVGEVVELGIECKAWSWTRTDKFREEGGPGREE